MSEQELIAIIEESMDLEAGTLGIDDSLSSYEEWDSLAYLSLAAFVEQKIAKLVKVRDIKSKATPRELIELIRGA